MASHLVDVIREFLFGTSGRRHIPNLDGALRPNEALQEADRLGPSLDTPQDVAVDAAGQVFASSGNTLVHLDPGTGGWNVIARFGGAVSGIASHRALGLVAAVAGLGLVRVGEDGAVHTLAEIADALCPTGVAVDRDGRICIALGSTRNPLEAWSRDLMEKGRTGKVLRVTPGRSGVETLAGGLAFPHGIAIRRQDGAILVAESWRHRVLAVPADGRAPEVVVDNLVGYPSGLAPDGHGGWWLAFLALRTQLVEFVLREDRFREAMIARIRPDEWIAPRLSSEETPLQPQQLGALRNHGIRKPWAPPKSYGLVVRMDAGFAATASLHSRSNGTRHGLTGVAATAASVIVASKGSNSILTVPTASLP